MLRQAVGGEGGEEPTWKATTEEKAERFLLVLLRYLKDWDQAGLSQALEIAASRISVLDRGLRPVPWETLKTAAVKVGFPTYLLDFAVDLLRSFVVAARGRSRADRALAQATVAELFLLLREVADLVLAPLDARKVVRPPVPEDRAEAERLWERLERRSPAERLLVVEEAREFQTWALCERVAVESVAKAPNHPHEALALAELALQLAERVPGDAAWRSRLAGLGWSTVSNARRILEEIDGADEALTRAYQLWEAGALGDRGLLNAAWLPWIEAILRRDQRHFPLALQKIEEALALDRGELRGKILVSKSNLLAILGDAKGSTAVLEEAIPQIDGEREPRLALVLHFNLLEDLYALGRAVEAAPHVPVVRQLAERLGGDLDLVKVRWLEGKVAFGLGRIAEAMAAFVEARRELETREMHYLYALVSLDLALLLLEQGRTAEVRAVAKEMLGIFKAQGIEREALAALRIFCDAAEREVATVELVRRVERFLRRAQLDRGLRFAEEG
jgi:tetratricopeptide (TPR) repeat protein